MVAALGDLKAAAPSAFDDAVAMLEDPAWDDPGERVSKWSRDHVKQVVWEVLLVDATLERIERLWFLAAHPDARLRRKFVADALSSGRPELLERAEVLLHDDDPDLRGYAAIGLRNAIAHTRSHDYARRVLVMLVDHVVAFPTDGHIAAMMAIEWLNPDVAVQVRAHVAEAIEAVADPDWSTLEPSGPAWGDYGRVLVHGLAWNLDRTPEGSAQLERCGPFVPPLTLPSGCGPVVTAEARSDLEGSGLRGLSFRPVVLAKVVNLAWQDWDLDAPKPARYPAGGEPENYVLRRKHNPTIAATMPPLFELEVPAARADDPRPVDLDLVHHGDTVHVSAATREWMEPRWGRWIGFGPDRR